MHPRRIVALLVHADGAVHAVVDHHKNDVQLVLDRGGQLLPVHLKTAVPVPRHHDTLRVRQLGRDCRRHSVAHRAAVGGKLGTKLAVAIETVQPHGIVARAIG